jgi:hypothetical protein
MLKNLFVSLNSLQGADASLAFRLDADSIIIAERDRALAIISEENDVLELSFDPGCPYGRKISLVRLVKKAAPDKTVVIGPNTTLVQLKLTAPFGKTI